MSVVDIDPQVLENIIVHRHILLNSNYCKLHLYCSILKSSMHNVYVVHFILTAHRSLSLHSADSVRCAQAITRGQIAIYRVFTNSLQPFWYR